MKRVFVLISLVVPILVIVGNAFAQDKTSKASIPEPSLGPEWKLIYTDPDGTTLYVNTRRITHLSKGIVKVWTLWVDRGEMRRGLVNALKHDLLSKGKDPNNAEKFWYDIELYKLNCKTNREALLEVSAYSFGQTLLVDKAPQHAKWENIIPGSIGEGIEKHVCNESPPSIPAPHKTSIPDPSLSSKWILAGEKSDGTTGYFNTRRITYLPGGIVKVRYLWVPRGGLRRRIVNFLKGKLLSKREDPNNAEKFWYDIELYKLNCKTHQDALMEITFYSFGQAVLGRISWQPPTWYDIDSGSLAEAVENYACNEGHTSIPDPSLSSKWKLVDRAIDSTTVYVDTRRITHLPKGIVKVWTLYVPRGETRRTVVNVLKNNLLYEGKDPNEAERFWYNIRLDKFNCKTHQFATLEDIFYSFGKAVLYSHSHQHEKWHNIILGTVVEREEKYVCKEHKEEK